MFVLEVLTKKQRKLTNKSHSNGLVRGTNAIEFKNSKGENC
jgi:hypothetical protein